MIKLDPNINIDELITLYPNLVEVLSFEYGLHCVNCLIASYDTLKEGAEIHGIVGEEFDDMIKDLENIINSSSSSGD